MLREGSRSFTAAQIAEQLDYYGAWLELTGTSTHACITLYSLCAYLPQTLEVLHSLVVEPTFPEPEFQTVVANNLQQFRVNCSRVSVQAHRAFFQALFGSSHPCGHLLAEDDYHRLTTDSLRRFYADHYHSGGLTVFASGRVTPQAVSRVESLFGTRAFGVRSESPLTVPVFTPGTSERKRHFVPHPDALQSAVRMGQLTIAHTHPDYLKLRVLVTLFGGYFGSRLMQNIRESRGYTYGVTADMVSYPHHSVLAIQTDTDNAHVEPLIREVYTEIDRLHTDLVPQSELTMVQNYLMGELCRGCESAFSLSDAWIFTQVTGLPATYYTDLFQAIRTVTPDELRDLARRYLRPDSMREAVCGEQPR